MNKITTLIGAMCMAGSACTYAGWLPLVDDIRMNSSHLKFDQQNNQYSLRVNILNKGGDDIEGSFRLLITNASVPVINYDGITEDGKPYILLEQSALPAHKKVAVDVAFELQRKRPRFTPVLQVEDQSNGWQLVWQDEFDGDAIDTSKWSFEENCWGGGNNEQQCYTARPDNAYVNDGILNIVAKKETFTGPNDPNGEGTDMATLPYTSARLRTLNKGDWQYGRFEIRAKLPSGQGTWPAIWMLPTDWVYGGWAASGEIDIVEAVNLKTQSDRPGAAPGELEDRVHGTLHYGRAWPENVYSGTEYHLPGGLNPADDFHVYALEWEEGEIRWYVDGKHYATQREDGWYSQYKDETGQWVNGEGSAPFNQKFHMLLNLAVGGAWAGNTNEGGIDESVFPQRMLVDYVRVYECNVDPASGAGCATVDEDAEIVPGNTPPDITPINNELGAGPVFNVYTDAPADGLQFNAYNPEGAILIEELAEPDRGQVFQLTKTGAVGNMYLNASTPIDMQHWLTYGDLVFDVMVVDNSAGSEVLVKLDSGWPAVSDQTLSLPDTGVWQQVRLPVEPLIANGNRYAPGSTANLASIVNPFVIEPTGPIVMKFDNVRFEYSLSGRTEAPVFIDADVPPFSLQQFVASGEVVMEQVASADADHGQVKQLTFNTNESVVYFQSMTDNDGETVKLDVSSFDALEFDLKVLEDPRADRTFMVKMDCGFPCSSGDFPISAPDLNVWQSYQIPLADLVTNPGSSLNLSTVDTPLVVFPAWGNQQGVVMQVDNVRLIGDGDNSNNPPTEVVVTDALTIFADDFAEYWQAWDCCANASLNVVTDETMGAAVEVDFFGPAPTVSGLQASLPHNVSALSGGFLSFDFKLVNPPNDASANWLLKVEGRSGSFAQVPLVSSIEGQPPQQGLWQVYTFALADLEAAGVTLDDLHLILVFPDWGKAQGAIYRIDNVKFYQ